VTRGQRVKRKGRWQLGSIYWENANLAGARRKEEGGPPKERRGRGTRKWEGMEGSYTKKRGEIPFCLGVKKKEE